ncbi:ATP-dependent RecD-like DNA helicase [Caballeronia sp. TF1N1]|uniref:ATP-dependent DNA helicase n=1 Tax=Caballeronia sp. TF1N1 TaxID=2878153 RepID=UPI001FD2B6B1|nr:AAA family ATPase [Caballeronia sp. TF1N1]
MEHLKTVPLNQGQQTAADGFMDFLFSPEKEIRISGPGGVGKTYLMSHLIDQVMPSYLNTCKMIDVKPEYNEVVMTATTNKAAEVLAEATKRPTSTIHSFMNLVIKENYTTGRTYLDRGKGWVIHSRKIIFIDEASMIDTELLTLIREGTINCKIVFVGDDRQLNPVMESVSPVYGPHAKTNFFELTEQMRTNNPDLQRTNSQLRQTVKDGKFLPIKIVPGVIDLLDSDQMEAEIAATFKQQTFDSRILCYTNNRVKLYNQHIRDLRGLGEDFTVGEFLVNNGGCILKNGTMHAEEEVEIKQLSATSEWVEINEGDAQLECVRAELQNRYNEIYQDVMIPVDRDHYDSLLKYYKARKDWRIYYGLKNGFPDLRQRDAATTHKAQGSTYETVFIDLGDLSTCRNPDQAARLLYVAFSRARRRVVCYGDLASKFGGLTT